MSNPFTNSTPEFFDECIYHCEKGWLPVDGEPDMTLDVETAMDTGLTINSGMMLLWPTEFTACPCNPLYSINPEMEAVV